MPRPVVGTIIDIKALGKTSSDQRLLEHRQESGRVLGEGKGGIGDDTGGIIDEGGNNTQEHMQLRLWKQFMERNFDGGDELRYSGSC